MYGKQYDDKFRVSTDTKGATKRAKTFTMDISQKGLPLIIGENGIAGDSFFGVLEITPQDVGTYRVYINLTYPDKQGNRHLITSKTGIPQLRMSLTPATEKKVGMSGGTNNTQKMHTNFETPF